MTDTPRLIEHAFPLKQASLDSVHEKNVRHGHISTLHIWPARRPLAACRAALIATLLPDPGTPEGRKKLCEKIGGRVVKKIEKKKMPGGASVEREKEQTEGGILHWLGEEPASGGKAKRELWKLNKKRYDTDLAWFRAEIRKAYGDRAPKVLDPFAGGGAIPLEAMRLGCEATAIDINPVAWFILKCTLEYPQKLAGQKRPLPAFILDDKEFMERFHQTHGGPKKAKKPRATKKKDATPSLVDNSPEEIPDADLAWHVRAWGQWVLAQARKELAKFYPVYADFEPLAPGGKSYEKQPMRLVPLNDDGTPNMAALNRDFSPEYLAAKSNPRWVAKPTVAYLWARTVTCKNCRATIPLLKTRWLCKKDNKRVLLTMEPNRDKTGVVFGIAANVLVKGSNAAQKREHDKKLGKGTMSRAGADCPCCELKGIMTMEDIRVRGKAKELGTVMTAVVVDGQNGKSYREPTQEEVSLNRRASGVIEQLFVSIPFGITSEETPLPFGARNHGAALRRYGMTTWADLFLPRQLLTLGVFLKTVRAVHDEIQTSGYPSIWVEAITGYLASILDSTLR